MLLTGDAINSWENITLFFIEQNVLHRAPRGMGRDEKNCPKEWTFSNHPVGWDYAQKVFVPWWDGIIPKKFLSYSMGLSLKILYPIPWDEKKFSSLSHGMGWDRTIPWDFILDKYRLKKYNFLAYLSVRLVLSTINPCETVTYIQVNSSDTLHKWLTHVSFDTLSVFLARILKWQLLNTWSERNERKF
jgi:hypothetical protein